MNTTQTSAAPAPWLGSTILTKTALQLCGGLEALRCSEDRWPYEVVVATHRSSQYPPEQIARMSGLSAENVFFYPDGSIQFCARIFRPPITVAYDQLLEIVPWGNLSPADPLVGQVYRLYCSAEANQRVYGEDCLGAGGEGPQVADPADLGVSVVFRRRLPTAAAIGALAVSLQSWRDSVAEVSRLPAASANFLNDRFGLWGNVAYFFASGCIIPAPTSSSGW